MGIENKLDQLAGKAKEVAGKVTDNEKLEAEGKADQVQAKAAEGVDKVKDTISGVADSFKN